MECSIDVCSIYLVYTVVAAFHFLVYLPRFSILIKRGILKSQNIILNNLFSFGFFSFILMHFGTLLNSVYTHNSLRKDGAVDAAGKIIVTDS